MPKIVVLRLGHRPQRDKRVTTHVALVARAFGADGMVLADVKDKGIESSVRKVVETWGGPFFVQMGESWRNVIEKWKNNGGEVVHLTVYGIPIQEKIGYIRRSKGDKLIVVGAKKVPRELFDLADYNIGVSQQPHSEVAALAVFLHMFFNGRELNKTFASARFRIKPQEKGKAVVEIT
jgi:tRNA (cytidine56-2'-O)-methyltransferase